MPAEGPDARSLADLCYRNPRLTVLVVGFLLVGGLNALVTLDRQEDPTMTERFAGVTTVYPGATAERVEALVSEKIETALREIPEIKTLESSSRAGFSAVEIDLYDQIGPEQVDGIWSEVRDKLGEVPLPTGAGVPDLEVRNIAATTLAVALSMTTDDGSAPTSAGDLGLLSRLARELEVRLANTPGTKRTEVFGAAEEQLLVRADPSALAAAGLDAPALVAALRRADTRQPAGTLRNGHTDLLVEAAGELDSAARVAAVPLRADNAGRVLRLGDVARVEKQPVLPPASMAFRQAQRAVVVGATMEDGQRVDAWRSQALGVLERFEQELPRGVSLQLMFDQSAYTTERLTGLTGNLLTALVIVELAVLLLMGLRAAVVVGLTLPLTLLAVLGAMRLLDLPLHQMSVTGLIISLGLLIDNAIVVVEDVKLRRRKGLGIPASIRAAVRHLAVPLAASTATTVFAFAPVPMAEGPTGEFTGGIAIGVILAVTSSYLLAMTVVPAIGGFLERRFPLASRSAAARDQQPWWHEGLIVPGLRARYRTSVAWAARRPLRGLAIGVALPLVGFALAPTLTLQFFPPVDRNQFQVQLQLPASAGIEATAAAVARLRARIHQHPEVLDSHWFLGETPPRYYYNVILQGDGKPTFAAGYVTTTSSRATAELLPGLQRSLLREFPEAEVMALPFEQGPPFDAPISLRLIGPELATLRELGDDLRRILADIPSVTYTRAALSASEPKLLVTANENALARAGLGAGDVPAALATLLTGTEAGFVLEGTERLPIRVRVGNDRRRDANDLASLPLVPSGQTGAEGYRASPIEELATLRLVPAAATIDRYQGERTNRVRGYLMPFVLPASALADFQQRLEASSFALPAGYRLELGGEAEQRGDSTANLLSSFMVFLVLMAGVVVLSLNSFRQAGIIGLVALLSVGLALFGIRLFGWPLGFTAMIGALGLVGLAINGAIIVLSALKADPLAARGDVLAGADVVVDATRHIVSTTVTTIGGFIPLILFGGTFWPPLATGIAGGVAGSALLALYTVPALYLAGARRQADAQAGDGEDVGGEVEPVRAAA